MGDVSNDKQRLPEVVYVRRRVAAVVVILVLVALVVWGLVAFANRGSDDEPPAEETTTAAAVEETTTPEEEPAEAEATTGEDEDADGEAPTEEEEPAPQDSCELSDLQITATSDRPSYGEDVRPTFYMTVDNPTAEDCVIDLDDEILRFEVYNLASNERMWSDTDCSPSVEDGTRTFPAGEERHFQAVWSRLDSAPGQCDDRDPVPTGGYFLHAVIGDNPSDAHTFNLG